MTGAIKKYVKNNWGVRLLLAVFGTLIYAIGMNWFIKPVNIYSSGLMGICQLIDTFIRNVIGLSVGSFDLTGFVYYAINIPIMIIAWKTIGKKFLVKTIVCATTLSLFLSLVPIPQVPILVDDVLANCIIGGIFTGIGEGMTLLYSCSMGGLDIIGILVSKKHKDASIGKVFLIVNAAVYGICLFMFDVPIVIYSLIMATFNSFALDKMHKQNINVEARVITKCLERDFQEEIMKDMGRGITMWEAKGAYTMEEERIFYICISKYEVEQLTQIVRKYDPTAYIVVNEKVSINGNFIKKL